MSRVVQNTGARVEIVEPHEAGADDPAMQDWLLLPVGDSCPADPSHERWGTVNPRGYFRVRRCHECNARFREAVTSHTIHDVVGALCGYPKRFGLGRVA